MPRPPFPHMMAHDVPLFASFVLTPDAALYTRWEFDVHLGQGYVLGPEYDPAMMALALEVTRLRVDAVGWDGLVPTLFEVKPEARLQAFGQILAYKYFWELERHVPARIGIITDSTTPDVQQLYAAHGINLYIVQEADLSQVILACSIVKANCSQLITSPA